MKPKQYKNHWIYWRWNSEITTLKRSYVHGQVGKCLHVNNNKYSGDALLYIYTDDITIVESEKDTNENHIGI